MSDELSIRLEAIELQQDALTLALVHVATLALSRAADPAGLGEQMVAAAAGPDPATVPIQQKRDALARQSAAKILALAVSNVRQLPL